MSAIAKLDGTNGMIESIGVDAVVYNAGGRISKIGSKSVEYFGNQIYKVGADFVFYIDKLNRIDRIGPMDVYYNHMTGRISTIGGKIVYYK